MPTEFTVRGSHSAFQPPERGTAHITLQSTQRKTTFQSTSLLPTVAILDPSMTASMPPRLTAATGMAALARCVEAFSAVGDHPMADAIAKYFQAAGADAERRIRLFRLAWDFLGSDLGGRGELYERFYLSDSFRMTALAYKIAEKDEAVALVDQFLHG